MYNYFENTNNCKNIFQFDIVPPHTSIFYLPTDLPPKQTRKVLSPLVYLVEGVHGPPLPIIDSVDSGPPSHLELRGFLTTKGVRTT